MTERTGEPVLPCGFRFEGGALCLMQPGHVIHRGRWSGPEPNHDYQPGADRRKGERRLTPSQPVPSGLDVEPGHNHTTGGYPTFPVFREACPLGCDALRAGEIAANTGKRPNLAVVDPFVEVAAMQAVQAARLAHPVEGSTESEPLSPEEWSRRSAAAMRRAAERLNAAPSQPVPSGLDADRLAEALEMAGVPWSTFPEAHTGQCIVTDHYRLGAKRIAAEYARLTAATVPAEPEPENPWLDRLVKAERENHCGDAACMTRRVSTAVRVLTGGKEHQDYCWAVEIFEVELGVRDPETVGREPSSAMLDAARLAHPVEGSTESGEER